MSLFNHYPSSEAQVSTEPVKCRYWFMPMPTMDVILPHYVDYRKQDPSAIAHAKCEAFPYYLPGKALAYRNPKNLGAPVYVGTLYTRLELEDMGSPVIPNDWKCTFAPWHIASELFAKNIEDVIVTPRAFHIIMPGDIIDPDNWGG